MKPLNGGARSKQVKTMNLNKEIIADMAQRPAFVNDYQANDAEGNQVTKHGIRLTKMENGQSVTLKITSDPNTWPEVQGQFGKSVLGFFEVSDGTPVSILINPQSKAAGRTGPLVKGQPAPAGKTLLARLCEFREGDIVNLSLEVKTIREPTPGKRADWRCFSVESAAFQ